MFGHDVCAGPSRRERVCSMWTGGPQTSPAQVGQSFVRGGRVSPMTSGKIRKPTKRVLSLSLVLSEPVRIYRKGRAPSGIVRYAPRSRENFASVACTWKSISEIVLRLRPGGNGQTHVERNVSKAFTEKADRGRLYYGERVGKRTLFEYFSEQQRSIRPFEH